ncbi:unnamed protein product [Staurois parvus]|uniref:Uncharacterized protein n=1 Tax=Staurois parvus TaxID=386267 RepID=A0ABN9E8M9_9NEOB|nr:unnamed protein product [Staurois parvus]
MRSASLVSLALTPLRLEQRESKDQGDMSASGCCLRLLQMMTLVSTVSSNLGTIVADRAGSG